MFTGFSVESEEPFSNPLLDEFKKLDTISVDVKSKENSVEYSNV